MISTNRIGLDRITIRPDKSHIVVDCDEVLVRISPKWTHLMHVKENFDYFSQFFRLSRNFNLGRDYEKVLMRPKFHLDRWLLRPDVLETQGIDRLNEARRKFLDLYNGDFYGDLPPTNLANALSIMVKSKDVTRLSIISRTIEGREELDKSKVRFLKNLFNGANHKTDIYLIDSNEKKSDIVNQLGNDIGFIFEDEISNVEDILENSSNLEDMTILIPSYGYNGNLDQKYYNLAAQKNIKIEYYLDI